MRCKDADAIWSLTLGGKEKEIHVHLLRNFETPWPLICQSSIQPIICTMKTGCKTSQVNRNRIKHNSFISLNMVTEQTRWQKAANTEGKRRSLYISVIPFPSQPNIFICRKHTCRQHRLDWQITHLIMLSGQRRLTNDHKHSDTQIRLYDKIKMPLEITFHIYRQL